MTTNDAHLVPRRRAPPPPPPCMDDNSTAGVTHYNGPKNTGEQNQIVSPELGSQNKEIPRFLGVQLIELVRVGTQAPHAACVEVATLFLGMLRDELGNDEVTRALRAVEQQITKSGSSTVTWNHEDVRGLIGRSDDAMRFRHILSDLAKRCRSDRQHRSTYFDDDDDADVVSTISELCKVCTDADPRIIQYCVAEGEYRALQTLISLFCIEVRPKVRTRLIDTFLRILQTDKKAVTILLESTFALEVARQFTDLSFINSGVNSEIPVESENTVLSARLLRMLTALFATGEALPVALGDFVNQEFVAKCLMQLEAVANGQGSGEDKSTEDDLVEQLFELLVAFNLHFSDARSNVLIAAMRTAAADTRTFTEKLLSRFNVLDDPLENYRPASNFLPFISGNSQTTDCYPNPVAKTLADCYEDADCATLFYTNDEKALVDILLRFVVDLSPGDSKRSDVLRLTLLVVRSAGYADHRHRSTELRDAVINIVDENTDSAAALVSGESRKATADERRERSRRDKEVAQLIVTEIDRLDSSI